MNETFASYQARILGFAAVVEIGTGTAFTADPSLVVALLLGEGVSGAGMLVARCFGIALIALGLACWPNRNRNGSVTSAFRGMLAYNALIALYLACLGIVGHFGGPLLWPAVVLHAVVAASLAWTWRKEQRTRPNKV